MTPMFSIIIPCYNCEKYISECLNSIITQDYDNYELICLDDCSQDKTTKIIENYSKKDKTFLLGVWLMLDVLKSELQRLNLYYKKDYINYCATVLNWHINEKKSFSSAYRKYYINVRRFMIQNRQYLDCNMVYLKIIRTSYIKQMFKYILKGLK